ncbi:MAG TPA: VWA domain-containing protein, partial [Candidatus Sulfotelmatobacter sp.]|nr:VWA domain-containing protein [Candidatus Sulfotelmatobacter sp.]
MRRRNNCSLLVFFILTALSLANSQAQPASPEQPASTATPQTTPSAPASGATPGSAAQGNGSSGAAQSPDSADSGVFIFHKQVDEVLLHATVVDDKQHIVTNLDRGDFNVYEDGHQQTITSFRHEDIPVAMGIVVDNSGSMREKRQKVNAAALNLVRSSNPHDEVFIVNFNDEYYLDQDFTSNINKLKEGLEKIETRGGTALYDAVVASADHLKKEAKLEKKVIFVVTDGDDNESGESLEQAVRRLQAENGPTVYSIGILEKDEHPRHAKRALQIMSERTGGIAFFPNTLDEVDAISRTVAHDIRTQYAIGYKPTTPKSQGGYRQVKVSARSHSHGKLIVRTKSGYY